MGPLGFFRMPPAMPLGPWLGPGAHGPLGPPFKNKASRPARGPPMAAKSALACLLTKAKPWRHLLGPGDRKQPHHSAITAPKCPRDLKFFSPSANISCGACLRRPCGAAKQALRSQPPALSRGGYPLGPGLPALPPQWTTPRIRPTATATFDRRYAGIV